MSLEASIQRTVKRTVARTGTSVILRRITPGVYNTTTGTVGNGQQDYAVKMTLTTYSDRETLASAGSIQSGDRKALLSASDVDFAPLPKDQVLIDDVVHDVLNVSQESGLSQTVAYILQLRR